MKKVILALFVVNISIFLFGCSKQKKEPVKEEVNKTEEVIKLVKEFNGFSAKTKVTYFLNNNSTTTENTFEMLQDGVIDGRYKIEVTAPEGLMGNVTLFDGESIYHSNAKRSNQTYVSANEYDERVEILLTSFIDNYKNKNNEYSKIGELTNGEFIVLEGVVDGSNAYFAKEQLILDGLTYKPLKLNIYSSTGEKFVEVEYLEFTYNPTFDATYFSH